MRILLLILLLIPNLSWAVSSGWYSTLQGNNSDVQSGQIPNGSTLQYNTSAGQWQFSYATVPAGGSTGYVLTKNSGSDYDYSWQASSGGSGTPGGSNTQVQYNSSGSFAGSSNFVFNGTNVGIGTSVPLGGLQVANAGNVGINTLNPGEQLDVHGTIRGTDFITSGPYTDLRSIAGATPNNSSIDNEPYIATCLANATSTCFIPDGTWWVNTEIYIPTISFYQGKHLLMSPNAVIKAQSGFSPGGGALIYLRNQAQLNCQGGILDVSAVSGGFTGNDIYTFSSDQAANGTGASNCQIIDNNFTSTGINLLTNSNGTYDSIYSMAFHDIIMYGVNTGISLVAEGNYTNQNTNGNMFHDIQVIGFNVGIYLNQSQSNGAEVYGNMFNNIYLEANSRSGSIGIESLGSWANSFTNVQLWDLATYGYDFDVHSAYNTLKSWNNFIKGGGAPTTNIDAGTDDDISSTLNPVFQNNVSINTTSQVSTLIVTGGPTGGVSVGYKNNASPLNGINSEGAITIGTTTAGSNDELTVQGNMSVGSQAGSSSRAPTNGALFSGNVGIGTNAPGGQTNGVSGNNGLSVVGAVAIGSAAYAGTSAPVNSLIVSGNVGIGSVNPGTILDVNGSIRIFNSGSASTATCWCSDAKTLGHATGGSYPSATCATTAGAC